MLKEQSLLSNGEIETPVVLVAHPQFLLSPEQLSGTGPVQFALQISRQTEKKQSTLSPCHNRWKTVTWEDCDTLFEWGAGMRYYKCGSMWFFWRLACKQASNTDDERIRIRRNLVRVAVASFCLCVSFLPSEMEMRNETVTQVTIVGTCPVLKSLFFQLKTSKVSLNQSVGGRNHLYFGCWEQKAGNLSCTIGKFEFPLHWEQDLNI